MNYSKITEWCHEIIRATAKREGFYIDATMGKGNDTLLLCQLAGACGHVLAFDIQEEALIQTEMKLRTAGYPDTEIVQPENEQNLREIHAECEQGAQIRLVQTGHEYMDRYAEEESADVICFNFGYLPGGDHNVATRAQTSIEAIGKGLRILKRGGLMSLCIYSGGDTGFEEKEKILKYLKTISGQEYTVIVNEYYNRENNPPMPVFIYRR